MYLVLLLACLILAFTNGNNAWQNTLIFYNSLTSYTAFYLVSMVIAITMLGHLHQEIGAMEKMINGLRFLIRDPRSLLMVIPAVVSLFSTVPGGAIISAPMVEETGRELKMNRIELAVSNMVYRHMVVLITPFNTSLIMVSGLSGISIGSYLGFTVPVVALVFLIAAVLLYIRYPRIKKTPRSVLNNADTGSILIDLITCASPYILAIILGLAFGVFFPLAMLIGIAVTMLIKLPAGQKTNELKKRFFILLQGFNWPIALSTLTIVFFKDFMLESESFLNVVNQLLEIGVPLLLILIVFPFITGFISGNNTASLGIALPVIIPLLGSEMLSIRYFGLVYLSSYAGYLGSPVHLCTYLTNEYFKTPLYTLIAKVNIFGVIMLVIGLALSVFY